MILCMRIIGPPYGSFRQWLTKERFPVVLTYWVGVYVATGLCFALLYEALPVPLFKDWPKISKLDTFLTILHFSFVTQSTVGYGDLAPVGWTRAAADAQALVGLALNAVLLGAVTTSFLSYHASVELPKYLVYQKSLDVFWFRFINCDVDSIVDARLRISVAQPADSTYTIESAPVKADYEERPLIEGLVVGALKTTSNHGRHDRYLQPTIDVSPLLLSPLNLVNGVSVRIVITGRYGVTGNGVFLARDYGLSEIRCGSHQPLNEGHLVNVSLRGIRGLLNREPESTSTEICKSCSFLNMGCPLDVATSVRSSSSHSI